MESIIKFSILHDCFQSTRTTCGDMKGLGNLLKKESISLFLLTTEFLNFNIQGQYQLNFRREEA